MDINAKAIKKALTILDALGAQYKVIAKDGDEFGTLEVVVKSTRAPRTTFIHFGYKEQIRALKLGECQRFTAPDGISAAQYRSVLSSAANQIYGKGAVMTSIDSRKNTIDALRIQ
jgi:hypothetical protein